MLVRNRWHFDVRCQFALDPTWLDHHRNLEAAQVRTRSELCAGSAPGRALSFSIGARVSERESERAFRARPAQSVMDELQNLRAGRVLNIDIDSNVSR